MNTYISGSWSLSIISKYHFLYYRQCFFTTTSVHNRNKFIEQLNYSFRSGGMTCGMDNNVLPYFIQSMKRKCSQRLPTKQAVFRPGKPDGSSLYFVNEDVILDENGKQATTLELEQYVWLKKELLSENDKLLVTDILPEIKLPLYLCLKRRRTRSRALPKA